MELVVTEIPISDPQVDLQEGPPAEPSIFVYYKFRLTLDDEIYKENKPLSSYKSITQSWFTWLQAENYITGQATAGCEVKNSKGDFTRPHFHIVFKSTAAKATIAQALRRKYLKDYDEKLSGNKMYSLVQEHETTSEEKFFRYPLKQQDPDKPLMSVGFKSQKTRDLCVAAKASYIVACQINCRKAAHKEEAQTLYDRLEKYLDKQPDNNHLVNILKFYVEDQKPINDCTIVGYFNVYRLKRQLITYAEYADKLKSRYNV